MRKRKRSNNPADPYEVGYGKPPRGSQFKSGESGNPKGRPKRKQHEHLHEAYTEMITLRINGKLMSVNSVLAMALVMRNQGLKGSVRAATLFFSIAERIGYFEYFEKQLAALGVPQKMIVEYVPGPSPLKPVVRT